jgi:hypothetical protein
MSVAGCHGGYLTDPRAYFFALIGRTEGSAAPDWKAVLESLPGKGMGVNPKPGMIQPTNAPHYGITVMIDAGGNARGRIWLPSDGPPTVDDNGNRWFTHEFQVIADGPTPGSFVWAWQDKVGAPYSPHACDSGSTQLPEQQPPTTDIDPRIAQLQADVDDLKFIVQQHWMAIQMCAHKGDAVSVTGKVSGEDIARRRKVTWTGTIS